MSSWLYSALRTAAQVVVGYAVTWLGARGIDVPLETQAWLVQVALVGGGIALYTAVVRWLEDRRGAGLPARAARAVARLLMLGLGQRPLYASPAEDARVMVRGPDGAYRPRA